MSDCKICHVMLVPYIAIVGVIAYFVTPWVLLILLAGYNCKDSCKDYEPKDK